jgi:hypothetical protein
VVRFPGGDYSTQVSQSSTPTRVALTPRDAAVFRDLARHRVLSIPWLCRVHFDGREPATAERLRKLTRAGYVEHLATLRGEREGYRLTGKGRRHLGVVKRPTPRDGTTEWHALHAMTTAEIALAVTSKPLEGTGWTLTWLTEQELVDGRAPWLPLADHGRGFVPDGVMVFTHDTVDDERRAAVEVELHEKTPSRYVKKLAWYRSLLQQGILSRVRWYVPNDRVGDAVDRALDAAGLPEDGPLLAEVKLIEEGIPIYGKAHLTRAA